MTDKRRIEIAGIMRELISQGWTLKSFDEDFYSYDSDEIDLSEKREAEEIFAEVWDQVQEEVLEHAPSTTLLRGGNLSQDRLSDTVLAWYSNADEYTDNDIEETMDAIIEEVNNRLPVYMVWIPQTSEVMGRYGQRLTDEEFNEALDQAYDKVFGTI